MGARLGALWTDSATSDSAETPSPKTVAELLATEPALVPGAKNISPSNLKKTTCPATTKRKEASAKKLSGRTGNATTGPGKAAWSASRGAKSRRGAATRIVVEPAVGVAKYLSQ